jgi:hypothetical protein
MLFAFYFPLSPHTASLISLREWRLIFLLRKCVFHAKAQLPFEGIFVIRKEISFESYVEIRKTHKTHRRLPGSEEASPIAGEFSVFSHFLDCLCRRPMKNLNKLSYYDNERDAIIKALDITISFQYSFQLKLKETWSGFVRCNFPPFEVGSYHRSLDRSAM